MKKFSLCLLALSAILLSGCETFNPYTGEKEVSNTAKGAGIGAGIGAVLAYLGNKDEDSKTKQKRVLQGAGIGAIAGGGVGYYMDTQEAKLRKQLRNSGVSVVREGDNINLVMPGNITFVSGSDDLNQDFYEVLDSVVLVLLEFDKTLIVIAGHTDSVGSDKDNQRLSRRRAYSVTDYLLQSGVTEARVDPIGFGEKLPIADNATAEGRALNRRVELSLVPITEEN